MKKFSALILAASLALGTAAFAADQTGAKEPAGQPKAQAKHADEATKICKAKEPKLTGKALNACIKEERAKEKEAKAATPATPAKPAKKAPEAGQPSATPPAQQ